jgi:hypothetical protein
MLLIFKDIFKVSFKTPNIEYDLLR